MARNWMAAAEHFRNEQLNERSAYRAEAERCLAVVIALSKR